MWAVQANGRVLLVCVKSKGLIDHKKSRGETLVVITSVRARYATFLFHLSFLKCLVLSFWHQTCWRGLLVGQEKFGACCRHLIVCTVYIYLGLSTLTNWNWFFWVELLAKSIIWQMLRILGGNFVATRGTVPKNFQIMFL